MLSTFLAVQSTKLANKRFDVKVDDVQFVGYPVSVKHCPSRRKGKEASGVSLTNVNVVFALPVSNLELFITIEIEECRDRFFELFADKIIKI